VSPFISLAFPPALGGSSFSLPSPKSSSRLPLLSIEASAVGCLLRNSHRLAPFFYFLGTHPFPKSVVLMSISFYTTHATTREPFSPLTFSFAPFSAFQFLFASATIIGRGTDKLSAGAGKRSPHLPSVEISFRPFQTLRKDRAALITSPRLCPPTVSKRTVLSSVPSR